MKPIKREAPVDHQKWDAVEEATELLNEERFREALVVLKDVLVADPRNHYAYFFTGVALYECGEMTPARDAYRACLALAPDHLGARVALAHVLRKLGDLKGAISEGIAALERAPEDPDVFYALGLAYLSRGDNAAARKFLRAFLDSNPEFELNVEVTAALEALEREMN